MLCLFLILWFIVRSFLETDVPFCFQSKLSGSRRSFMQFPNVVSSHMSTTELNTVRMCFNISPRCFVFADTHCSNTQTTNVSFMISRELMLYRVGFHVGSWTCSIFKSFVVDPISSQGSSRVIKFSSFFRCDWYFSFLFQHFQGFSKSYLVGEIFTNIK